MGAEFDAERFIATAPKHCKVVIHMEIGAEQIEHIAICPHLFQLSVCMFSMTMEN